MDALIKSAKIISPNSPFHLQTKDILIEKGTIVKIGKNLSGSKNIIEVKNLCVSDGWIDLFSVCLLYTSPSPRDRQKSRMPSSA